MSLISAGSIWLDSTFKDNIHQTYKSIYICFFIHFQVKVWRSGTWLLCRRLLDRAQPMAV
jgi:hypothetical protein